MQATGFTAGLIVLVSLLSQVAAAEPPAAAPIPATAEKPETAVPKFIVYSSEADAEFRTALFRVLRGNDKVSRIAKADTIEKAVESEVDVLVLIMTGRKLPELEAKTIEALKKRKIVGIGAGAAVLFGKLGLEINLGACAHSGNVPPPVRISRSALLGDPKSTDPIQVCLDAPEEEKLDNFAVFLPPGGSDASVVDVIARWAEDPNYAPIVRQGNCILIGVPVPATRWTDPYANLIKEVCQALLERKTEPFSTARRELTKPGTYEFKLAKRGSPDEPFEKTFYFRFSEATRLTARLEHSGSEAVMLIFMGQDENRMNWTRRDARNQEALEIASIIRQEQNETLGERYWVLKVTNFGGKGVADCKLKITCETPEAVE